jgi:hypothetical protein
MKPPKGYTANTLEFVERLLQLPLPRLHLFVHHTGGPGQCAGIAYEQPEVNVYGRVLRGAADREVAELDRAQVPERLRQP